MFDFKVLPLVSLDQSRSFFHCEIQRYFEEEETEGVRVRVDGSFIHFIDTIFFCILKPAWKRDTVHERKFTNFKLGIQNVKLLIFKLHAATLHHYDIIDTNNIESNERSTYYLYCALRTETGNERRDYSKSNFTTRLRCQISREKHSPVTTLARSLFQNNITTSRKNRRDEPSSVSSVVTRLIFQNAEIPVDGCRRRRRK